MAFFSKKQIGTDADNTFSDSSNGDSSAQTTGSYQAGSNPSVAATPLFGAVAATSSPVLIDNVINHGGNKLASRPAQTATAGSLTGSSGTTGSVASSSAADVSGSTGAAT